MSFVPFAETRFRSPPRSRRLCRNTPSVALPKGGRVAVSFVINYEEGSELPIPMATGATTA